jgi:hypothetical protein
MDNRQKATTYVPQILPLSRCLPPSVRHWVRGEANFWLLFPLNKGARGVQDVSTK